MVFHASSVASSHAAVLNLTAMELGAMPAEGELRLERRCGSAGSILRYLSFWWIMSAASAGLKKERLLRIEAMQRCSKSRSSLAAGALPMPDNGGALRRCGGRSCAASSRTFRPLFRHDARLTSVLDEWLLYSLFHVSFQAAAMSCTSCYARLSNLLKEPATWILPQS